MMYETKVTRQAKAWERNKSIKDDTELLMKIYYFVTPAYSVTSAYSDNLKSPTVQLSCDMFDLHAILLINAELFDKLEKAFEDR
jgi:hypothetical protein